MQLNERFGLRSNKNGKYRIIRRMFFQYLGYSQVQSLHTGNVQSTLVISNSLISNNRLSRSENLVPVLIQRSTNRQQNIVEKRRNCSSGAISSLFLNIFNISLTGVKLHIHSVKGGCSINCFPQFRKSDMSKYGYLEVFHRVPWSSRY